MSPCACKLDIEQQEQLKVLWWLLALNATMFVVDLIAGWKAESTGLIADAFDMLADAFVYGIGLYAVGRSHRDKARAALASGVFQVALSCIVVLHAGHRFIQGGEPWSEIMIAMGMLSLAVNLCCLALISRYRHGEVHMRASWIFSSNDVLANLGVILGGILVHITKSPLPDLAIGLIIGALICFGGVKIIREARMSKPME